MAKASEDDARSDDKGSDPEDSSLGQALSSFWSEAQKTLIAATRDAASQLREMADEERKKREEKYGPDEEQEDLDIPDFLKDVPPALHDTKETLFDWVRLHQPNVDVEDVIELTEALWAYYSHWCTHGSGSVLANERPLQYANQIDQIADIIINRARSQGVTFEELPRILVNSSSHAARLFEYVSEVPAKGRGQVRKKATAMRFAATLRDSLDQAARLVQGEELDEPDERIYHRTEKTDSGSITQDEVRASDLPDDDDTIIVYHPEGEADAALRMGFAYKAMKEIKIRLLADHRETREDRDNMANELDVAMKVIKGDIDVPTNGGNGG